jgi:hypothetical protein
MILKKNKMEKDYADQSIFGVVIRPTLKDKINYVGKCIGYGIAGVLAAAVMGDFAAYKSGNEKATEIYKFIGEHTPSQIETKLKKIPETFKDLEARAINIGYRLASFKGESQEPLSVRLRNLSYTPLIPSNILQAQAIVESSNGKRPRGDAGDMGTYQLTKKGMEELYKILHSSDPHYKNIRAKLPDDFVKQGKNLYIAPIDKIWQKIEEDPYLADPFANYFFQTLVYKNDGNIEIALSEYNAGPKGNGREYANKILNLSRNFNSSKQTL